MGKLKNKLQLENLDDDYKLEDVKDESKTEKLILPFEEKEVLEKEYTLEDLRKRILDSVSSENDLVEFLTFDVDKQKKNKIIFSFNMPSETPEE